MSKTNDHPHHEDKHKDKRHRHRNRAKHPERPCPNPPAAPDGVAVTFKNNGTRVHPDFSMKIKWNGVFEDEQGAKIPGQGVEIDHYQVRWWPTRANGTEIDSEDGDARVRQRSVKAVKGVRVTDAVIISGTTAEFTTKKAHGLVADEIARVQDIKPPQYNGRWTVLSAGLTSTKFRADIGASPANTELDNEGTVEGEPDPNYNIIVEKVPHPKRWWWQAQVRAWDNKNCPSDWSEEITVVSPLGNVRPPQPNNVLIFQKATDRIVVDWDDPVEYVEVENGTVSGSSGSATLTGTDTDFLADLADAEGVGKPGVWIKVGAEIKRVTAIASATSLTVHSNWASTHTDVPYKVEERDPDIHHYQIQIDTSTDFDDPYHFERKHHRSRFSMKIKPADDQQVFYGRVRSEDHEGKHSKWVPAGLDPGNSSASATPDGVYVGKGGKVRLPFHAFGPLELLDEADSSDIELDEVMTVKRVRARVKQAPTGDDIILKLWHNDVNLVSTITIPDGTKRGFDNGINYDIADEDWLSISIDQVGSTTPGHNLTVLVVLD